MYVRNYEKSTNTGSRRDNIFILGLNNGRTRKPATEKTTGVVKINCINLTKIAYFVNVINTASHNYRMKILIN